MARRSAAGPRRPHAARGRWPQVRPSQGHRAPQGHGESLGPRAPGGAASLRLRLDVGPAGARAARLTTSPAAMVPVRGAGKGGPRVTEELEVLTIVAGRLAAAGIAYMVT